jgi:hypothetical protein
MRARTNLVSGLVSVACILTGAPEARAAEIDGAWATAADACSKIFVKQGATIGFAKKADLYGSGFIIAGNRIKGKVANCTVKMRKDDGDTVNLAATCSTDVAVETVQFVLKVHDRNSMSRVFMGIPELDTPYVRCTL